MRKKRALAASRIPDHYIVEPKNDGYIIHDPGQEPSTIVLTCDTEEMIKISKTGFYVRGVKVEQDDKEAEVVYNAFREWMVYSAITRNY